MSVNLIIAFDRYSIKGGPILCYERYRFDWQDYDLFDKIIDSAVPLPEGVQWYEDEGLKERFDDPYGTPLTWIPSHTLARLLADIPLQGWDAAMRGFLEAIPPDTKIVLRWS